MTNIDWKKKYEDLVRLLNNVQGFSTWPMGHLKQEEQEALKGTPAYRVGWNDAYREILHRYFKIIEQADLGVDENLTMLLASDTCFLEEDGRLKLNMNDTWGWALSWLPVVPRDQVDEVARLFTEYGIAGLRYWHSCQENNMKSEFHDINRQVEFVRNEERIKKESPDHNARAYYKTKYTIG